MYIHSVKLINYKSIGDYSEAEVILEPKVTAIIGKNESGKSNVLDGLSQINFIRNNAAAFSIDVINRNSASGTENSYNITLKTTPSENEMGLCGETEVLISKNSCLVSGGFFEYYKQCGLPTFEEVANFLNEIGVNPFQIRDQELTNYRRYMQELQQSEKLDLHQHVLAIDFLYARISKVAAEYRERYRELIKVARDTLRALLDMFPTFFKRKTDKHLNVSYKVEEIEKELKSATAMPNSLLQELIKLIGISAEDFILASRSGLSAQQETLRRKINRLIEEKINKPFQDFYKTESITLDIGFNAGVIKFSVQSDDGAALILSERSHGLRWYLETFIDAQANNMAGRNVVYLFDEPGTSLHVNAQRELLRLFRHLSERGNQVVYTTHSPYMLDIEKEGIHRIRAVTKNNEGFTYIYKTAYDSRIASDNQQDTLAPIISAIGMNLNDTFGPSKDKINIVTEGMSDYIYLCMMAKVLDIDTNKYAIIPSVGASNCINICSILHGWGCRYIAVFDYDDAGVKAGEYLGKEMMLDYNFHYCYLADVSHDEVEKKTYKATSYMIEDLVTREEIDKFCAEMGATNTIGKSLLAKLMCNAVEANTYQLGEESKSNFRALFNRIFSYCKETESQIVHGSN